MPRCFLNSHVLLDWRPGQHFVNRGLDLDIFSVGLQFASRKHVRRYHSHGAGSLGKLAYHVRRKVLRTHVCSETDFHFNRDILNTTPPCYLAGLWQSYRYFETIQDKLRSDFTFREPLPVSAQDIVYQLQQPNSICLHVRRGDYISIKNNADVIGFVGLDYYRRGVEYFCGAIRNPRFFVFSDEVDWCKEHLAWLGSNTTFVSDILSKYSRSYPVELHVMTKARKFIIANSTFGWWAAWLAGAEAKVVAPMNWFRAPDLSADDLIPSSWIKL